MTIIAAGDQTPLATMMPTVKKVIKPLIYKAISLPTKSNEAKKIRATSESGIIARQTVPPTEQISA